MLYKIQKGTVEYGADVILDNIDFEIKNKNNIRFTNRKYFRQDMMAMRILQSLKQAI